nr:MAG TPA: hypothetical protein [Caudoviricetes sp.]
MQCIANIANSSSCYEVRIISKLASLCRNSRKLSLFSVFCYIYSRPIGC